MPSEQFHALAKRLGETAGTFDTIVVAAANTRSGEMARVIANPSPPELAAIGRSLLQEALDLMEEASDDPSMDLANRIEAAIACLPAFDGEQEAEHL